MSFVKLKSLACHGLESKQVVIEVLKTRGLSQLLLTGLPDAGLKESRDKIRALVSQMGHWGPLDRLHVNLLPAEENKVGAHLELPIALGCLAALADSQLKPKSRENHGPLQFCGSPWT